MKVTTIINEETILARCGRFGMRGIGKFCVTVINGASKLLDAGSWIGVKYLVIV
jgi:hypothetical protein